MTVTPAEPVAPAPTLADPVPVTGGFAGVGFGFDVGQLGSPERHFGCGVVGLEHPEHLFVVPLQRQSLWVVSYIQSDFEHDDVEEDGIVQPEHVHVLFPVLTHPPTPASNIHGVVTAAHGSAPVAAAVNASIHPVHVNEFPSAPGMHVVQV